MIIGFSLLFVTSKVNVHPPTLFISALIFVNLTGDTFTRDSEITCDDNITLS